MATACSRSAGPRTVTIRSPGRISTAGKQTAPFDPKTFFARAGDGWSILHCQKHQILFTQGDVANGVFYIQEGWVKLTVISPQGKEAVIAILGTGDFFGETCLAGELVCLATATSLDASTIVRIDRAAMNRVLHNEPAFSQLFLTYLLSRNIRIQEDVADQLLNSAERRLARTLLLLAHSAKESTPDLAIPKISQETLAEMIGTTRSRVSFFMNRFKKLGFIEYTDGLHVHTSLLTVVLAA